MKARFTAPPFANGGNLSTSAPLKRNLQRKDCGISQLDSRAARFQFAQLGAVLVLVALADGGFGAGGAG